MANNTLRIVNRFLLLSILLITNFSTSAQEPGEIVPEYTGPIGEQAYPIIQDEQAGSQNIRAITDITWTGPGDIAWQMNTGGTEFVLYDASILGDINILGTPAVDAFDGIATYMTGTSSWGTAATVVPRSDNLTILNHPSIPSLQRAIYERDLVVGTLPQIVIKRQTVIDELTSHAINIDTIINTGTADQTIHIGYVIGSGIDGSEEYFSPEINPNQYTLSFDFSPSGNNGYLYFRNRIIPTSDAVPYVGWMTQPSRVISTTSGMEIHYSPITIPAGGQLQTTHVYGNAVTPNEAQLQVTSAISAGSSAPTQDQLRITNLVSDACPIIQTTVNIDQTIASGTLSASDFTLSETASGQTLAVPSFSITPIGSGVGNIALGLALDRSSSFAVQQPSLNAASQAFVQQMTSGDRMAIVEFGSTNLLKQSLTGDTSLLDQAILSSPIVGDGGTNLYAGIIDAINEVSNSSLVRVVVVITDGRPFNDVSTLSDALLAASQQSVSVYTIGYGTNIDTSALNQLATQTGGRYYSAATTSDIASIFSSIRQDINQGVVIDYVSPFTQVPPADRTLTVEYNGYQTSADYQCAYSSLKFRQLDLSNFPNVDAYLDILDVSGNPITGLTSTDLCGVTERGQDVINPSLQSANQAGQSLSFALALDRSGSFLNEQQSLNSAAETLVNQMQAGDRGAIVNFGRSAVLEQALTSNSAGLINAINNPSTSGATALYDAIVLSADSLRNASGQKAIFVITDGADTWSSATLQGAISATQTVGVPVYLIAFGTGYNENIFRQIAVASNGDFNGNVTDSQTLIDLITSLRGTIGNQYVVQYTSPIPATTPDRAFEICIDLPSGQESLRGTYSAPNAGTSGILQPESGLSAAPGQSLQIPIVLSNSFDISGLDFTVSAPGLTITGGQSGPSAGSALFIQGAANSFGLVSSGALSDGVIALIDVTLNANLTSGSQITVDITVNGSSDVNGNTVQIATSSANIAVGMPIELTMGSAQGGAGSIVYLPVNIDTQGQAIGGISGYFSTSIPAAQVSQLNGMGLGGGALTNISSGSSVFGLISASSITGQGVVMEFGIDIPAGTLPGSYQFNLSNLTATDMNGSSLTINAIGSGVIEVLVVADGDVAPLGNRDGVVNIGDAVVALRYALGLITPIPADDLAHGDVAPLAANGNPNPDGVLNIGDAVVILRKALGLVNF